jgi:hypothetical protein
MLTDLKLDTSGISVPMDRFNAAVNAENLSNLDNPQAAQNRLIAYQNAREAMIGYQRVLSASGRSSDKSLEMNLATLPSPAMPEDFSRNAIPAIQREPWDRESGNSANARRTVTGRR